MEAIAGVAHAERGAKYCMIESSPTTRPQPRIVMLLANEFVHDTRVFKEARSLIEWGCEVHVVATHRPDLPSCEEQQDIIIHRVEVKGKSVWTALHVALLWWSPSRVERILRRRLEPPPAKAAPVPQTAAVIQTPKRANIVIRALRFARRVFVYFFGSPFVMRLMRAPRALRKRVKIARDRLRRAWGKFLKPPPSARMLACNIELARKAITLQPDVIESHDLNTLPAGIMLKRVLRVPVVYDSHELFLERNIGDKSRRRDKMFWGPIERFCIKRADAVMTVANGICDHLQKRYKIKRPALVRNVQPYEPPAPPSRLLSDELGIDHKTKIVLYPGAITINRGLEQMIDSSVDLRGAAYVVMGYARNPVFMASLKQQAEALGQLGRTVFFRDAVPIDDVVRYTSSADLGIVPTQNVCLSYQFESSNKIFHCLMAGVPVVMSDHSEKRHIAETHGVGLLFDETDPASIAATVNDALADRARYETMRRNCLQAARALNWQQEEKTLRRVFAEVLGERAPRMPDSVEDSDEPVNPARLEVEVLNRTQTDEVNEYSA